MTFLQCSFRVLNPKFKHSSKSTASFHDRNCAFSHFRSQRRHSVSLEKAFNVMGLSKNAKIATNGTTCNSFFLLLSLSLTIHAPGPKDWVLTVFSTDLRQAPCFFHGMFHRSFKTTKRLTPFLSSNPTKHPYKSLSKYFNYASNISEEAPKTLAYGDVSVSFWLHSAKTHVAPGAMQQTDYGQRTSSIHWVGNRLKLRALRYDLNISTLNGAYASTHPKESQTQRHGHKVYTT